MLRCSSCRHDNEAGARFCEECGDPLALECAGCGTEIKTGARFCPQCGEAVGGTSQSVLQRNVAAYTPEHLAEKILQSRAALEDARKQVK